MSRLLLTIGDVPTVTAPVPVPRSRDMLKVGLAWLTVQLRAYASETITYVRGADRVVVQSTFGRKLLKVEDGMGGLRVEWTDMDFLVPAADLVLSGLPIVPRRGDLIEVDVPGAVETFEVMPFGSEPAWRWSDPHQSMLRIHTKHVDTGQFYT